MKCYRLATIFLYLAGILAGTVQGQTDDRDKTISDLLIRVQALEREVVDLRKHEVSSPTPAPETTATERTADPALDIDQAVARADQIASASDPASKTGRYHVDAYADLSYTKNDGGNGLNHYLLGELDVLGTAKISDTFSALVEVAMQPGDSQNVNMTPIVLERLELNYRPNSYFNISAGGLRPAIGYYSTAFLRGSWLQTAVSRPRLFDFEEDGGILPLHIVGVSVSGRIPSGFLGLHYVAETGNGETFGLTGSPTIGEAGHKVTNFAIFSRPAERNGIGIGVSAYHDYFYPAVNLADMSRTIFAAHVVYHHGRIEFLNEGILARYRGRVGSGSDGRISGFYSQLGVLLGSRLTPYARLEHLYADSAGYFNSYLQNSLTWRTAAVAGFRYDINDFAAFKLEAGHESDFTDGPFYRLGAQLAFRF